MVRARSLFRHPLLMAAVLAVRLLVPTGYMPLASGNGMTLQPCSGTMPAPAASSTAPMHHAGMAHGGHKQQEDAPGTEQPCAFAGLAAPMLGAADPVLLAAAIAFALLLAVRAFALVLPVAAARLRPPLRAPPVPA